MKKGSHQSSEAKEKIRLANIGRKHSKESSEKTRLAITGRKRSEETKEKIRRGHTGLKHSEETKRKLSESRRGCRNGAYIDGRTPEIRVLRNSPEYAEWRMSVFIRDDFTCQDCRVRGIQLEAHHLFSFSEWADLRFDIDNGITLCKKCHETYGNKASYKHKYGDRYI